MHVKVGPRIEVDQNYWDFGPVEEGQNYKKVFLVKNIGNQELLIKSILTSCGCTTTKISSTRIDSNKNSELEVTYNTEGAESGKDSKDIYIISNDPQNPRVKITIEVMIVSEDKGSDGDKI